MYNITMRIIFVILFFFHANSLFSHGGGLNAKGCHNNKRTGDQGADLILKTGNHIIAVQAKRYSSNVGNTAIQEIYTSLNVYGANEGWVVASSGFTSSAKELARKNNVKLFDRKGLLELIEQAHAKILQQK